MVQKLKELLKLTKIAGQESVSMQRKLSLYWFAMAATVFGVLLLIFSITGLFTNTDTELGQSLDIQLQNTSANISNQLETLCARGISLSEDVTRELSKSISKYGSDVSSLNDNADALKALQKSLYPILNTTLQTSDASGVFVILDATTNTNVENAEQSRSGLYLRYTNLSTKKSTNQQVIFFRGIPDIAREENLELHNRWNLEFDISNIQGYDELMSSSVKRLAQFCRWTDRHCLQDTWEDVMLLCVPILDGEGNVSGVCGVEVSALYFSLSYPALDGRFGSLVSVLAPIDDGVMFLEDGMIGGTEGTYLSNTDILNIKKGRYYNTYSAGDQDYVGISGTVDIKNIDGREWEITVLLPKQSYDAYVASKRMIWIASSFAFLIVMLGSAVLLSRGFVRPIATSLAAMQSSQQLTLKPTGISEIDSLIEFVRSHNQTITKETLPSNIAVLFDEFAKRTATLTTAERGILNYYIAGHEISEIPDLAFISINTVRKHNKNIYEKLAVSSRDELMLYIDLFRRCGRLSEIETPPQSEATI